MLFDVISLRFLWQRRIYADAAAQQVKAGGESQKERCGEDQGGNSFEDAEAGEGALFAEEMDAAPASETDAAPASEMKEQDPPAASGGLAAPAGATSPKCSLITLQSQGCQCTCHAKAADASGGTELLDAEDSVASDAASLPKTPDASAEPDPMVLLADELIDAALGRPRQSAPEVPHDFARDAASTLRPPRRLPKLPPLLRPRGGRTAAIVAAGRGRQRAAETRALAVHARETSDGGSANQQQDAQLSECASLLAYKVPFCDVV